MKFSYVTSCSTLALAIGAASLGLLTGCQSIPADELLLAPEGRTFNQQGEFLVSSGDKLDIRVQGNIELDGAYVVSPSGHLSFPLAGIVKVEGGSIAQITQELEARLRPYIKSPRVTASLVQVSSFKVYFDGEVQRAGVITLTEPTSLLKALSIAGGLGKFATGRIVVVRPDKDGKPRRYAVWMSDLLEGSSQMLQWTVERNDFVFLE